MLKQKVTMTAISRALKLLARREYSVHELQNKLKPHHPLHEVEAAITQCVENQWVDDERFTMSFIRTRFFAGYGPRRILLELRQKGVSQSLAVATIKSAKLNWHETLLRFIEKKAIQDATPAEKMKFQQMLLRKGFLPDQIKKAMSGMNSDEI